jgi:hypothetical protein
MKHVAASLTLAVFLAATASEAFAQHAVPRGGGSSGGSSSGSSGGSSGGGSSSSGGSSGGGSTASSSGSSGGDSHVAVPRHPTGSGSTYRGGSGSGGDQGTAGGRVRSPGASRVSGGDRDGSEVAGLPPGSRPQGGRPTTGYAIPRQPGSSGGPGFPGGGNGYYPPYYYYPYYPWGAWGLGYIWNPYCYGYGWPCGYGYGGYSGYGGYGGYGYGGYASGGGYGTGYDDDDVEQGGLRIKVKPREARVVVDGYFVGEVDDFDGNFQKLKLDEGAHKVELRLQGFETLAFDVMIIEGQTVTYKGTMRQQ